MSLRRNSTYYIKDKRGFFCCLFGLRIFVILVAGKPQQTLGLRFIKEMNLPVADELCF